MADEIRPTPRSPILGLFSDLVNLPLQYMSSPQRTQQMQGVAEFIRGTGVPSTLERLSYGQGLFTGAGGLGGTTRLRPEVAEAALTVAPMVGPGARVAGRAVMATKGLPVGASIEDVSKFLPTSISSKSEVKNVAENFSDQFRKMGFDVTLDHSGSAAGASSYLRVSDPQTGRFLSKPIRISDHSKGAKELDANINVLNPQEDFAKITSVLNDMRAKGETLVFKQDKYAQELIASGVKPKTAYQRARTEITENQPSTYPQEEALRLAQQRAALPVSEGGLGLPPNNTPMDRARAMGFDTPAVHFSRHGIDAQDLDSGKFAVAPFDAVGTHVGTPEAAMSRYQNTVGYKVGNPEYAQDEIKATTYPVLIKSKNPMLNASGKPHAETPLTLSFSEKADYGNLRESNVRLRQEIFSKHDSIPYINDVEAPGSVSYIAPPQNIRSRFAAFDPTRRNEPDLLAGALPFTVLIDEENRRAMDEFLSNPIMYRDPFGSTAR